VSEESRAACATMLVELQELERDERRLSTFRRTLHERIDNGRPNHLTLEQERRVSDERRALHRRIDALRAALREAGLALAPTA
jgi:hypothetical protein